MALVTKGIFVVGAKRTPFCKYGGSLRELPASHAFAEAGKDALQFSGLHPSLVNCSIIGNVNFLSQCDGGKTPRYCGIYSGVPIDKPALGVNKTCGSGIQSIINGAIEILTGQASVVLSGGTELMSSLPFLVRNIRFGSTLGKTYAFEDYIKKQFIDTHTGLSMHQIAENIAEKYKINREMVDHFAINSRLKLKAAQKANIFKDEITSLNAIIEKSSIMITEDDGIESDTSTEEYIKAPALLGDGKIVTSLNSAVPADGAAALVLANESTIIEYNIQPLARITGVSYVGLDPKITGLGAVPAVKRLLGLMKLATDDVDLFEINETFASQTLATMVELNVPEDKVNASGGALSLGHPVAATGARMAVHAAHKIRYGGVRRVVTASSCGGGQGVAVMFEKA